MDDIGYMMQGGVTSGGGSPDGGAGIVGNYVLSPDVLAVRVVLFGNHDAGYMTRTFPSAPAERHHRRCVRDSVRSRAAQQCR